MRSEPLPDSTLVRAGGTLALVAVVGLLGSAWFGVRDAVPDGGSSHAGDAAGAQVGDPSGEAPLTAPAPHGGPRQDAPAPGVDPDAPAQWPHSHVVETGETLPAIADRYGLTRDALAEANALGAADVLQPGDVLLLPDPERPRPGSARSAADEAPELAQLLAETAEAFGLAPETVKAVAWTESRWDHGQVSGRGAVGVMQVRPQTAEAIAAELDQPLDVHDVEDNVLAGVAYLERLTERYGGDLRRALVAYVQGPTRLDTAGPLPAAERYADRVLRKQVEFAGARR